MTGAAQLLINDAEPPDIREFAIVPRPFSDLRGTSRA